jgi:hypothetical protein
VSLDSGAGAIHGPDQRYRLRLRTRYPTLRDAVATPDGNARARFGRPPQRDSSALVSAGG